MLIIHASQLLTLAGGPQAGLTLGRLSPIPDGAVLFRDGRILAVGTTNELQSAYPHEALLDAGGKVVLPGFVDPHTHAIWAGDRAAEFDLRLQGKTYLEILAAGGGILSTVAATRVASQEALIQETRTRLRAMFAFGTTTAEIKTGYGLEPSVELRLLDATLTLREAAAGGDPLPDVIPTFLGAHAIPSEFRGDPDGYTRQICEDMLPTVRSRFPAREQIGLPFVDVFCERGAFSLAQSRQILLTAQSLGFPLKIHADEFENLGGASLAVELGAVSADHLVKISPADIAALGRSPTVAVSLPCTPFGLAESEYTPAQSLLAAGATLALASDLNPGTAWCGSMQFVLALACRYLHLTPAQAIAASTINAAAALRMADKIGSIEPGKQADLLILRVADYRHLGYRFGENLVQTVIKHGKVIPISQGGP
jgi:imidazolonepropionase